MKYAMIIPDGAADVPLDELDGRTPLAVADTPNIDWITANGKCGTVANVPDGMGPGSDVAMLSVLGYDPKVYDKRLDKKKGEKRPARRRSKKSKPAPELSLAVEPETPAGTGSTTEDDGKEDAEG